MSNTRKVVGCLLIALAPLACGGGVSSSGSGGAAAGSTGTGGTTGGGGATGTGGSSSGGVSAQQWHPIDIALGGTSTSQEQDSLSATFTGPSGQTLKVPGFFDGPAGWKVRFSPPVIGAWTYLSSSSVSGLSGKTGSVQCVANTNPLVHGKVVVDATSPHYFRYEDGTQYILMGFEADWLGLMDFGDTSIGKAKSLIDIYASNGFNEVLMNVFAYDTGWENGTTSTYDFGPPKSFPWKGSNASPDFTQMNPDFFANFDRVVQYLLDKGVVAHIMFKVYNKSVTWPSDASAGDNLYFTYVTARYQAYPNILWDFSKESNNEPDTAYKTGRIALIRSTDAYHHPISTHTDTGYYSSSASNLDFRTDQNQSDFYSTIISHRNANNWPVLNSEFNYQIGNDGGKTYTYAADTLSVFADAVEIALAGGHFGYYYTYHAWDVVRYAEVPSGIGAYKNLYGLLSSTAWSRLSPSDSLINNAGTGRHCLANPGAEYVAYLGGAGSLSLNVTQVPAGSKLNGTWLNLITGQTQAISALSNGQASLTNPWSDPAILHLLP